MLSVLKNLVLAGIAWGALSLFLQHKQEYVPIARAWINDPIFEAEKLFEQKLSRQDRYALSYYFPTIFPISFVCKNTQDKTIYFPNSFVNLKANVTLECSQEISLTPSEDVTFFLSQDPRSETLSIEMPSGELFWLANRPQQINFRTSYLKLSASKTSSGKIAARANSHLFFFSGSEEIAIQRFLLPNPGPELIEIVAEKEISATLGTNSYSISKSSRLLLNSKTVSHEFTNGQVN